MTKIKYKDSEWLRHHYHDLGKTLKEMAKEAGVAHRTISYHMDKNNIETRDGGTRLSDSRLKDKEWCREQYIEKEKSMKEIARGSSASYTTVREYILSHGIEPRDAGGGTLQYEQLGDEDFLETKYKKEEKSISQISDMVGCSITAVFRALVRHGFVTRGQGQSAGEDHWNYQDGSSSSTYYGPSWRGQRKKALERAGYKCEHTGITQKEHREKYGKGLDVHHIVPFREFGIENHEEANRLDNLRVLSCTEHGYWENIPVIPEVYP
jgi:DNA-binding CsgD family transcriptional regulator